MKKYYALAAVLLIGLSLSGCSSPSDTVSSSPIAPKASSSAVPAQQESRMTFYKASADGLRVIPVTVSVKAGSRTPQNALAEMIRTDRHEKYPLLPAGLTVKSVTVENGTAFADFSEELNQLKSGTEQTLFVAMTVNTLTEFPNIQQVRFTAGGKPPKFQLDMQKDYKRDEAYIQK